MVLGVGIDLVRTARLREALARHGDRLAHRVFTAAERAACARKADPVPCLAMRFAAKEAFAKALGTGMRTPIHWQDVEVGNDRHGKPLITLSPRAAAWCADRGVTRCHLSLTDDGDYGAAIVVVEGEER